MRSLFFLLLIGLTACGSDESQHLKPPPEGFPQLATRYAIDVEIIETEGCNLAGLVTSPSQNIEAKIEQDGIDLVWRQGSDAPGSWKLEGRICETADGFDVALRGIVGKNVVSRGRNRVESSICLVETTVPSEPPTGDEPCADPGAVRLHMDQCGVLEGTVKARLTFQKACESQQSCVVTMMWVAQSVKQRSDQPVQNAVCDEG